MPKKTTPMSEVNPQHSQHDDEHIVPKENTIHKFDKLKQNYFPRWKKPLLLSTAKRRGTGNSAHLFRLLLPPKCHLLFVCNHHQHRSNDSQKVHFSRPTHISSSSSYICLFTCCNSSTRAWNREARSWWWPAGREGPLRLRPRCIPWPGQSASAAAGFP